MAIISDIKTNIIEYTQNDVDLLARLMRSEAIGEGDLGMLMVGNVVVNRIICNCLDFKDINTVSQAVYQTPGGFSGTKTPLFEGSATPEQLALAERCLTGETFYPATNALWYYAPQIGESCKPTWYNQRNSGRYQNHCFYGPDPGVCPNLY